MSEPKTFLVAEDEAMIAMLIEDFLDMLGHGIEKPRTRLLNIGTEDSKGTDALRDAGIPYIFATGGGDEIPAIHAGVPTLSKPFTMASLESVIAGL